MTSSDLGALRGTDRNHPVACEREVMGLEHFVQADIDALESSRPPAESVAFDHELNHRRHAVSRTGEDND